MANLGWNDWFKNRHLLGPIGNILPAEAGRTFHALRDALNLDGRKYCQVAAKAGAMQVSSCQRCASVGRTGF